MELLPLSITIPFPTSSSSNSLHKFKIFPFHLQKYPTRLNFKKNFEINSNINNNNSSNISSSRDGLVEGNLNCEKWEESDFVEVFGIGSRRDAILDFCTASPSLSTSLRFWNILMKDSAEVQLQQRYPIQDAKRNAEAPLSLQSVSKAVILVASTGYSYDHIKAIDIFREVKAGDGLVVGIILKPFSFEGQRRQDEC